MNNTRSNCVLFCLGVIVLSLTVTAQAGPDTVQPHMGFERHYERTEFLLASSGAMGSGLYGYDNPALLQYVHDGDLAVYWTADGFFKDIPRWGLVAASPHSSFSFFRHDIQGQTYRDYRLAFGGGTDAAAAGMAVNWYGGNTGPGDLQTSLTLGALFRPRPHMSVGVTGVSTVDTEYYETVVDLAVRPFGTPLLTLFGDYVWGDRDGGLFSGRWSAGAVVEALPGVRCTGRYLHDSGFTAGIQFSLGRGGVSYQAHRDTDGHHRYHSYSIRSGAMDRNLFDRYFRRDHYYVDLDVKGGLPYQNYRFLDRRSTFLKTLDQIHAAAADPAVAGIVIDATDMMLDPSRTWELRHALDDFRSHGKKVIIYLERGGMMTLHLTSAADYAVMDPLGGLIIPGFAASRTYLAEMLASIGIGVDEFREMEYKSAFEAFSRTGMSAAEREQTQAIIDAFYELIRNDVSRGRGISEEDFDALIDRGISLSPEDLLEAGVVDTLARFTEIDAVIEKIAGNNRRRIAPQELFAYRRPRDDRWGPVHKIAVLYAEGPTMTDFGIQARTLSRAIRAAREDHSVKAVVLRADSPGGDPLASDLVAEELRKTAEEKPVIVSMGRVAASGGYWISMYADTIVAAPNTLTGSIGVIAGWFWDEGLSERLRLHTDHVSRGKSADLRHGPMLPFAGVALPHRRLSDDERQGIVDWMNDLYGDFLQRAADGRKVEVDQIRAVADGRVWTGADARERHLVDELGSLYTAIDLAKEKAGIIPGDKVTIAEGPEPPPFSLPLLLRGIFSSRIRPMPAAGDPVMEYLQSMLDHAGQPMVIMPFEYFHWMYHLEHPSHRGAVSP